MAKISSRVEGENLTRSTDSVINIDNSIVESIEENKSEAGGSKNTRVAVPDESKLNDPLSKSLSSEMDQSRHRDIDAITKLLTRNRLRVVKKRHKRKNSKKKNSEIFNTLSDTSQLQEKKNASSPQKSKFSDKGLVEAAVKPPE